MKRRARRTLTECTCQDGLSADPADSVLRHVKILGFDSKNRRRYEEQAAAEAIGLYEGTKCNIDHPEGNPNTSRGLRDRFGKFENVAVEPTGLYGDLRYNPRHPLAEAVRWWAENQPDALGLSHNAVGQGRDEDGVFVVERIVSVRSVDLVADPATTKGLYESEQRVMRIKLGKFFESARWDAKHSARIQKAIKGLMEDDYMDPDMEMDGEEGPDHEAALKQGFDASCYAIIDDPDMSADEKVKRLKKLLKTHEKLSAGGDAPAEEEPTEEDDDEPEEDDDMGESVDLGKLAKSKSKTVRVLAERLDELTTKNTLAERRVRAERLIKEAKLPDAAVTDLFMTTLLESKDDKAMKALVEERRQLVFSKKPVSTGSTATSGKTLTKEEFRKALKK
jgi:hypothetical protein